MNRGHWTQDEIYDFLLLYKKHECLWNMKKASYANRALKDAAFSDIAAKMLEHKIYGLGPKEIKKKFYNLRSTYHQSRQRHKDSSVSPKHTAKWHEIMEHLQKNLRPYKPGQKRLVLVPKIYSISKVSQESEASSSTIKPAENQEKACSIPQKETDHISVQLPSGRSVKLQSRIEILNVLKKMYMEKVTPDYRFMFHKLTKIIRDDSCLTSSLEAFKLEMTKLGYLCKETIDGKDIIIESAEQRFERYLYLTKIRKIRSGRKQQIIYIDERILNSKLNYEKVSNLKDGLLPESSVFFHAISKDGFYKGLFINQACEEDFNKWVVDILLSYLTTPCAIIMDNGPLHGTLEDTSSVTRYSTKIEMMKWLNNNNIPCSPNLSKPELFELIRKNKRDNKDYKIDRILRSHGHEVLRLPHSFPDLNMTHILWNAVSDGNSQIMPERVSQQMMQNKLIDSILPSIAKKKWGDFEKILIMKENDIFEIDAAIENILDSYIFK